MKNIYLKRASISIVLVFLFVQVFAQNWLINGNSNISAGTNYLGTSNNIDLVFRTNALERGRVFGAGGAWRFGSGADNAKIDSLGRLSFKGKGDYLVGNNRYVFRSSTVTNKGLFYNSTLSQYEFRNASANPVFFINTNTGAGSFSGTLTIGAYTLPTIDGTNNQVLKTDGAGHLTWKKDNNTKYTAGTGISLTSNVITNTAPTQWAISGSNVTYNAGDAVIHGITVGLGGGSVGTNTALGYMALNSNTTGYSNVAIGVGALPSNTEGHNMVAIGDSALFNQSASIDYGNTAVGSKALYTNTTGSDNTANGNQALYSNTTGSLNTANGFQALYSNTTGYSNSANGSKALYSNTTGYLNTAIGSSALYRNTTGYRNTANGGLALYSNKTGDANTANGYQALYSNETGDANTATGEWALFFNTSGGENTANGTNALHYNTTGAYNTAIGNAVLFNNTTGSFNVANGSFALYFNTTGFNNTATGNDALYSNYTGSNNTATGNGALYYTNGNNNTALGDSSGSSNQEGNGNTLLGAYADVSSRNLFNATAIGYNAKVSTSNTIALGDSMVGVNVAIGTTTAGVYKLKVSEGDYGFDLADPVTGNHWEHYISTFPGNTSGGAVFTAGDMLLYYNAGSSPVGAFDHASGAYKTTSDEKMKTNIKPMMTVLDKINLLEPVTYNFRNSNNPNQSIGFIAQKVEKLFPSLVTHYTDTARKTDVRLMDYSGFGVIAIKGIQELESKSKVKDSIINIQQQQIETLKNDNADLRKQFAGLKAMVLSMLQCSPCNNALSKAGTNNSSVILNNEVILDQNIPNPLSNTTSISYFIPNNVNQAQLVITDMTGKNIKQITLQNGKGNVTIDASTLSAGAYSYSLMVNGKIVATKKMMVAH